MWVNSRVGSADGSLIGYCQLPIGIYSYTFVSFYADGVRFKPLFPGFYPGLIIFNPFRVGVIQAQGSGCKWQGVDLQQENGQLVKPPSSDLFPQTVPGV